MILTTATSANIGVTRGQRFANISFGLRMLSVTGQANVASSMGVNPDESSSVAEELLA